MGTLAKHVGISALWIPSSRALAVHALAMLYSTMDKQALDLLHTLVMPYFLALQI